ncbi:hypothetical protein [Aeromonas veronii]|uniref:hypothetical protein n=1 Tax=Aeromonas veronii TaxID=654 RepID=UPI002DBEB349|nr:hypothetical protein [Aeromonas veronii]MEB5667398.1 hypothetical protein [Aeromonas veronii]
MHSETENEPLNLSHRPIKSVSIEQLEMAFSNALDELTGKKYKVTISKLDLSPDHNAWLSDSSYLELTLSSPPISRDELL